jgi:hypothetical protein
MSEDGTKLDVTETPEKGLSIVPGPSKSVGNILTLKKSPGRPKKIEKAPTQSDLEYHALVAEEKVRFVDSDPLVRSIEAGCDTLSLLHRIKLDLAKETACLHFQRIENEKLGRDTAQVSTRRIDALERLAKIELKIREADRDSINLGGEKMQKVFALWVEVMREVAQEVLPPEFMDLFFSKFSSAMEDWEDKAQNVVR